MPKQYILRPEWLEILFWIVQNNSVSGQYSKQCAQAVKRKQKAKFQNFESLFCVFMMRRFDDIFNTYDDTESHSFKISFTEFLII